MATQEPQTITVVPSAKAYLETLHSHGLLQGEPGAHEVHDQAREALHALHVALAGGTVRFEIEAEGASSIATDLDDLLKRALEEWNEYPDELLRFF